MPKVHRQNEAAAAAQMLLQAIARSPGQSALVLGLLSATALISPAAAMAATVAGIALLASRKTRNRLPLGHDCPWFKNEKDFHTGAIQTIELGIEIETGQTLSIVQSELTGFLLVMSKDRSDRVEIFLGLASQAVEKNSGCLLVIEDSDFECMRLVGHARNLGRLDDTYVLDFSGTLRDSVPLSTLDPFAGLPPKTLASVIAEAAFCKEEEREAADRARSLLCAVIRAAQWEAERSGTRLTPRAICDLLDIGRLTSIASGKRLHGAPDDIASELRSWLQQFPGYTAERAEKQGQSFRTEYGYLQGALGEMLLMLEKEPAFEIGGDICFTEILAGRRNVVVHLPNPSADDPRLLMPGRFLHSLILTASHDWLHDSMDFRKDGDFTFVSGGIAFIGSPFHVIFDNAIQYVSHNVSYTGKAVYLHTRGVALAYGAASPPSPVNRNWHGLIVNSRTMIFAGGEADPRETAHLQIPPFVARRRPASVMYGEELVKILPYHCPVTGVSSGPKTKNLVSRPAFERTF